MSEEECAASPSSVVVWGLFMADRVMVNGDGRVGIGRVGFARNVELRYAMYSVVATGGHWPLAQSRTVRYIGAADRMDERSASEEDGG